MAETARHAATWDDLVAAPDDRTYEILGGVLESAPRPLGDHGRAQGALFSAFFSSFDRGRAGPGGWWLVIEPEVRLRPHDIVVPDVVGWRRERLPRIPRIRPIDVVPDWICEVMSPGGQRRDRVVKSNLYLTAGIPSYWILDLEGRTLEALEAREEAWLLFGTWSDGDTPRIRPFETVELDVGGLLPPPEEPA
jgi:Uma2 family endonuclease